MVYHPRSPIINDGVIQRFYPGFRCKERRSHIMITTVYHKPHKIYNFFNLASKSGQSSLRFLVLIWFSGYLVLQKRKPNKKLFVI